MERKIKLAAAISLVGLSAAACAPNPYWRHPGYTNRTTATAGTNNKASVTHSHNGKVHSHPLPQQGIAHTHGAGQGAGYNPQPYNPQPPQVNPQPYNNNNAYYVPPASNNNNNNTTTYGYDSYNYSNNNNTSSSSGSYYDYSKPKDNYYSGSSSSSTDEPYYYNYSNGGSSSSSTGSSSSSSSGSTYSGGDTYVVQKGDTVFQVMRSTGTYWKDIIRLNNLQAPDYPITPGQRLRLK